MAHKLLSEEVLEAPRKAKWYHFRLPNLAGKFGVSIFIGKKEVFVGVAVGEVEIEQVIRRRLVKVSPKAKVKVFRFDSI